MSGKIADYYNGKSILMTGTTGFVGKVILEKLLFACPGIETIFIFIRPKRDKTIETRLELMLKSPLFDRLRQECPARFKKIVPIPADLLSNDLGLHEEHINQINKVSVVFHAASIVMFDVNLKELIKANVEATYTLLEMCKTFKQLELFIYVSTAFCNSDQIINDERIHRLDVSPIDIINMCKWMKPETIEKITPDLLGMQPNNYTYSKRLAETLVDSYFPELPVCVTRPSIVLPTYADPFPGWVENLYGAVAYFIAGGKGIFFSFLNEPNKEAECVPVDGVANLTIATPWYLRTSMEKPFELRDTTPVINMTKGNLYSITLGTTADIVSKIYEEHPFEMMLWYPFYKYRTNVFMHYFIVVLFQWIPACFIDLIMVLIGHKPFLINIQKKLYKGAAVYKYFVSREWNFVMENYSTIYNLIDESEKSLFNLNFQNMVPEDYLFDCIVGIRKYLLKEDPATIPRSKIHYRILYYVHHICVGLFYLLLGWILFKYSGIVIKSYFNY